MSKFKNVGGQAVIEGVMMRGTEFLATAVRKPTGEIVYKKQKISMRKNGLLKKPFIRGVIMLFDSLVFGVKELTFSANQSGETEEQVLTDKQAVLTVIFAMSLGVGLFMLLPSFISNLIFRENRVASNLMEAILRLVMFVVYVWAISFSKDVRRIFQYHGAEHKTIYAYENDLELSVENSKKFTTLHPRCGTSFLIIVMLVSILVFFAVDFIFPVPTNFVQKILMRLGTRIIFVPLVAAISYEIQRYSSRHLDNYFVKLISAPGLSLQKITTHEPDDSQLEVAVVALRVAIGQDVQNAKEIFV
ncbi:MAG: DUF1385 domain-containing protein [Fusobacteriaceae bacterium]